MMKLIFTLLLILPHFTLKRENVEVIKFHALQEIFNVKEDKIKIINFWATWCKPCIMELPQFEHVNRTNTEVKVILVSLDDVETLESKVIPFVESKGMLTEVKLLDETDYNAIIEKIHPEWSGAIPATLVIDRQGEKHLFEKEFKEGELYEMIGNFIN
jgi:thiol-disulfide isomerase/thioredoxin